MCDDRISEPSSAPAAVSLPTLIRWPSIGADDRGVGFSVNDRNIVAPVLPLFAGLALLMIGNGLLGSLLGIRAHLDEFPTVVIGIVMAMYYVGFLVGSLTIPRWLVSVGHIRVYAGLAALASATAYFGRVTESAGTETYAEPRLFNVVRLCHSRPRIRGKPSRYRRRRERRIRIHN